MLVDSVLAAVEPVVLGLSVVLVIGQEENQSGHLVVAPVVVGTVAAAVVVLDSVDTVAEPERSYSVVAVQALAAVADTG